jgi:micrococcal nuclease
MEPKTFTIFFILVLILVTSFIFIGYSHTLDKVTYYTPLADNYVTRVIDGDTFVINSGETIRLLCVDTPEKNTTGYEEATTYLESLILNKEVILNPSITNKDQYGRLLRYVYVENNFVNKLILDNQYGELLIIPPENCTEMN